MKLRDRVTGAVVADAPETALLGRWLIEPEEGDGPLRVNGCEATAHQVLVPDALGAFAVESPNAKPIHGRFLAEPMMNEQDVAALLDLHCELHDRVEDGWLGWSEISPLARGLHSILDQHPLETQIEDHLVHLAEVCRNPSTHIHLDTERVPVSRARRIARRASIRLASHTEDWEYRKISGVQPRRILALVREQQWDLYENRVAVRLLDHLVAWLRRRMFQVTRVRDDIYARLQAFQVKGNRHRRDRIYRLWGESWDDASRGKSASERAVARLERLLYRLLGLMDSTLYRRIARNAGVPRALRMTNLFRSDAHYRGVARLWRAWTRSAAPRSLSPQKIYQRNQDICCAFDAWCALLVIRACDQLHLQLDERSLGTALKPGCVIHLHGGYSLTWHIEGALSVRHGDKSVVRIVPLVHALERARDAPAVDARVDRLVRAANDNSSWTVILHPANPGAGPYPHIASLGNPPRHELRGAVDFVRVSPFSLDSVERVARVLRWATLGRQMLAYPPTLCSQPPLEVRDAFEGFIESDSESRYAVRRPLGSRQFDQLERAFTDASREHEHLEQTRTLHKQARRDARGDRRQTAEFNRQLRASLERVTAAESRVQSLASFRDELRKADELLRELTVCPACREPAAIEPRADRCFRAGCQSSSCSAVWELRYDPGSETRIPVFLPGGLDIGSSPQRQPQRWVDELLGCDVLAIPTRVVAGKITFLPPRTVEAQAR